MKSKLGVKRNAGTQFSTTKPKADSKLHRAVLAWDDPNTIACTLEELPARMTGDW